MFKKSLATALITAVLATGISHTAYAGGGGEGGFREKSRTVSKSVRKNRYRPARGVKVSRREANRMQFTRNRPSASYRRADGTVVEYTNNVRGERVRIERRGNTRRVERFPNRRTSWAHNHTTGTTAIGVGPGVRLVIGFGGIGLSF